VLRHQLRTRRRVKGESLPTEGGPCSRDDAGRGSHTLHARGGRITALHYCASKAAVTMFTQIFAVEMAPHQIRVNAIVPSLLNTESALNSSFR
jgi:NAD(P)-dependent dehydrogenase (short-subunit alcohol dehydrogenase family)